MIHGKDIPFQKNEDDHTREGWTRVDKELPGWGHLIRVLGHLEKDPDTTHEDRAMMINTGNSFMFWTDEWVAPQFIVTHWRKC